MKLRAYPGTYLIEKIKEKTIINIGTSQDKKIIYGKIVDIGKARIHDAGGKLEPYLEVGTILFFLNYAEHYDEFDWEGKTYYSVLFNDGRAYLE